MSRGCGWATAVVDIDCIHTVQPRRGGLGAAWIGNAGRQGRRGGRGAAAVGDTDLMSASQRRPSEGASTLGSTAWVRFACRRGRIEAGAQPCRWEQKRVHAEAGVGVAALVWRAWDRVSGGRDAEVVVNDLVGPDGLSPEGYHEGEKQDAEIQIAVIHLMMTRQTEAGSGSVRTGG